MRGSDDELEGSSTRGASEEDSRLLAALRTYADPARSPQAAYLAARVLAAARQKHAARWRLGWAAALLVPVAVCFVTVLIPYIRPGTLAGHKERVTARAAHAALPLPARSVSPSVQPHAAPSLVRGIERVSKQASTAERSIEPLQARSAIFPTPLPLSREEQLMLALVKTASPGTQQLIAHMTEPLLPSRTQADSFPRLSENQPQGVSDEEHN